ncbi:MULTISPECIES: PilZ domain-containing protein [unclassified Acinetobacter]|uniref:PilZ domain-containing protein n=1 Tax=unclassified Acinetobacter TaxID=196816 RepID=UPI0035B8F952
MMPKGGVTQINFPDKDSLQASYMQYVNGGGLFLASKQAVQMGQELFVIVGLPGSTQKFPIQGKVCWISAKASMGKPQGFAIQINPNQQGITFKNEAERALAGSLNSERPTFTM